MPDIIEELKAAAVDHDSTGYVMEKAADEIARLREALAECGNLSCAWTDLRQEAPDLLESIYNTINAALGVTPRGKIEWRA